MNSNYVVHVHPTNLIVWLRKLALNLNLHKNSAEIQGSNVRLAKFVLEIPISDLIERARYLTAGKVPVIGILEAVCCLWNPKFGCPAIGEKVSECVDF